MNARNKRTSSSDPDDGLKTYSWTQTAGAAVSLSDSSAAQPEFIAPATGQDESPTFHLTVTDFGGLQATDTCVVNVAAVVEPTNQRPAADAGADQDALKGHMVKLDGSSSSDPDGSGDFRH